MGGRTVRPAVVQRRDAATAAGGRHVEDRGVVVDWHVRRCGEQQRLHEEPAEDHRSCAISLVGIRNKEPGELAKELYERYQIFTVSPGYPGAVRISPNIYTSIGELDRFVAAMKELAAES